MIRMRSTLGGPGAPHIARAHICDVLIHELEFTGAAQNFDLLAAPVALTRPEKRKALAFPIDEVKR